MDAEPSLYSGDQSLFQALHNMLSDFCASYGHQVIDAFGGFPELRANQYGTAHPEHRNLPALRR